MLGIGRAMVYDVIRQHVVQSVKIGRRRLIPARALLEYVQRIAHPTPSARQLSVARSWSGTGRRWTCLPTERV